MKNYNYVKDTINEIINDSHINHILHNREWNHGEPVSVTYHKASDTLMIRFEDGSLYEMSEELKPIRTVH